MTLKVDAIYENGVLKPMESLSLREHEHVRVSIDTPDNTQNALEAVRRSYGLIHWNGDVDSLRRIAEEDDFGILESP